MLLKKTSHALHFNLGNSSSDQVEPQVQYLIYENLLAVVILTLV
jgi:hypothetical protein